MSTATLDGHRVTHARIHIPAWGVWHAEVTLDAEQALDGGVVLQLAEQAMMCAVVSGGVSRGRSTYRVVGGAGGWGTTIARRGYASDGGVTLSTVAIDAAVDCGETIDPTALPIKLVGSAYARQEGPASAALSALVPRAWYVGLDGVTVFGQRSGGELAASVPRTRVDLANGVIELAPETVAELLPGLTVDGLTVVDVEHELTPGSLRTTVWGQGLGDTSRRVEALAALVGKILPAYPYHAIYEYRVVTQEVDRLNLQPVRVSAGMPDLRRVRVRPGVAGMRADVTLGSHVLVTFLDGHPANPSVVGFADAESPGFAASVEVGLAAIKVALATLVELRLTEFAGAVMGAPLTGLPADGGVVWQTAIKTALGIAGWTVPAGVPPTTASSNLGAEP